MKNCFSPAGRPSGFFDEEGMPINQTAIDRLAYMAGKAWRPRPLDASGVLFRAKVPGEEMLPGYDFANGWGELFDRGLEIVQAREIISRWSSMKTRGIGRADQLRARSV